jgi:hypothetical protein
MVRGVVWKISDRKVAVTQSSWLCRISRIAFLLSIALWLAAQEGNIPPEIFPFQRTFPMSGSGSILVLWVIKVI